MPLNSSSSDSLPPPLLTPSNASSEIQPYFCFNFRSSIYIAASFTATKTLLLLPLCVLVLHLGHQRRRQRCSLPPSHSDVFSFHMMLVELMSVTGWSFFCCGAYIDLPAVVFLGYYTMLASFPGQMLFHCLTCVERYLAVVHPITYLALRNGGGDRIRNISIACVWVLCLGWTGLLSLYCPALPSTPLFCLLVFSVLVVSFCSLSVFSVLIRPGPGDAGGARERVDRSKRKAVVTIVAIMAVLLLHFVGFVLSIALRVSKLLSYSDGCAATVCAMWFSLPSSLLLPLLFLHRTGRLALGWARAVKPGGVGLDTAE